MNFPLLTLELRKNRLSAASMAAAFLVTLPVSRLVASTTGMEPGRALEAILLGWLFLGTPFAAALIGASSGAFTAARDSRDAEALLPASPRRRAAASLASSALLLAAVAALILAACALGGALDAVLMKKDPAMDWTRPLWTAVPIASVMAFTLADALLGSWIVAYLLGHGVAGGLIGSAVTAGTLFVFGIGCGLEIEYGYWGVSILPLFGRLAVAALAAKCVAALGATAWRERSARLGAGGAAALAALALLGPLSAVVAVDRTFAFAVSRVRFSDPALNFDYQAWSERSPASPAALAAQAREAIVYDPRGGLYAAGKDGLKTLIPEDKRGVMEFVNHPFDGAQVRFAERDERGVLWVMRTAKPSLEFWRGEGGAVSLVSRRNDGDWLTVNRNGRRLLLPIWNHKDGRYYAFEDYARSGEKGPSEIGLPRALARGEREAGAAKIACDGRCLKKDAVTWRLPGPALSRAAAYPHWVAGKPAFLIPTASKNGPVAVLCREGGRVETAWPMRDANDRFWGLPDGTLFAYEPGDETMAIIGADGARARLRYAGLKPKDSKPHSNPSLVHREGGRAWLVWGDSLIETGAGGAAASVRRLRGLEDYRVVDGGLLYDDGRSLRFQGWDGTARRLVKP